MKYKIGDRVRIVKCRMYSEDKHDGQVGAIEELDIARGVAYPYKVRLDKSNYCWAYEIELIDRGEVNIMTKYYRVIKDTTQWQEGAILEQEKDNFYRAVEDIWNKVKGTTPEHNKGFVEAEENADFFERVYKNEGEKLVFVTAKKLKDKYNKMVS